MSNSTKDVDNEFIDWLFEVLMLWTDFDPNEQIAHAIEARHKLAISREVQKAKKDLKEL